MYILFISFIEKENVKQRKDILKKNITKTVCFIDLVINKM